jgi:mannose-6-phosphate isomerase-like protein (cupin superfamily)
MTFKTLIPAVSVALVVAGAAVAQPGAKPMYVASKDVDALVAKTKDGVASAKLPTGSPSHVVMVAHRVADGEVEVHKKLADEIIVRTGHARIQVGGTVTGQRQTAPDEFRGGTMTGGQVFDLKPGDAIWIPVGQPHQVLVAPGGQITYTAAKFPG